MVSAPCRAACGSVAWSQQDLAGAAKVGVVNARQFAAGAAQLRLGVIQRAPEAGIIFIAESGEDEGPRVRLRKVRG